MTKLQILLQEKNMTQRDLQRAVYSRFGIHLGDDRISKMVTGRVTNYSLKTARLIADALQVTIDSIVEKNP